MVKKLNDRLGSSRRTSDSKRVTFDKGQAKSNSGGLPMKTSAVDKE